MRCAIYLRKRCISAGNRMCPYRYMRIYAYTYVYLRKRQNSYRYLRKHAKALVNICAAIPLYHAQYRICFYLLKRYKAAGKQLCAIGRFVPAHVLTCGNYRSPAKTYRSRHIVSTLSAPTFTCGNVFSPNFFSPYLTCGNTTKAQLKCLLQCNRIASDTCIVPNSQTHHGTAQISPIRAARVSRGSRGTVAGWITYLLIARGRRHGCKACRTVSYLGKRAMPSDGKRQDMNRGHNETPEVATYGKSCKV